LEAVTGLCDIHPHNRMDIVMTSYTIRSPLAMGACLISGALSILLLVEPSFHEGLTLRLIVPVAVSVGLVTMAIITGVLAHGHGLWTASGAALAVVSVGLSGAIVWEQSGRRAQTRVSTQTVAVDATKERARLTQLRAEADQILTKHRADQARECASGKGKRCDGMSYTVRTWEAALEGYDAKLRGVPAPTPDAKVETIGTAAKLAGYDADKARAWVSLIDPLLVPLLLELAAILCGVVAFGPVVSTHSRHSEAKISDVSKAGNVQQNHTLAPEMSATSNVTPIRAGNVVNVSDDETIVVGLRRLGGTAQSQRDLARVMGISPAEVSKRLAASPSVLRVREDNRMVVKLKR
jgi:hypothetical protein